MDEFLAQPSSGDFRTDLTGWCSDMGRFFERHRRFHVIIHRLEWGLHQGDFPATAACAPELKRDMHMRLDKLMKRGLKQKVLRPELAEYYAYLLLGLFRSIRLQQLENNVESPIPLDDDRHVLHGRRRSLTMVADDLAADRGARAPTNKWLVTVSITFGTLMGTIDASIVNVAVPHLSGSLGATVEQITWVTTGFALANVIVMPLTAFLGPPLRPEARLHVLPRPVPRRLACCAAWRARSTMLVACRVLQGFGAGALQPTEQAILRQTFPPEEQGMAMALFGIAVMIGPAFGPTLGGYIVDNWSWPWIFYINLPVGPARPVHGAHLRARAGGHPRRRTCAAAAKQRKHMDWSGIALLVRRPGGAAVRARRGHPQGLVPERRSSPCSPSSPSVALLLFVARELTATVPAVNLTLFKDKVFLSGTLIGGVMFAMLMSVTFILPVFMQTLLGYDAMQLGHRADAALARHVRRRAHRRAHLQQGAAAHRRRLRRHLLRHQRLVQMSHYTLETSERQVILPLLIQGVGFACLFVPLTTVALSSIDRRKLADATGLNSLVRQIGGSFGLAVFATLMSRYPVQIKAAIGAHITAGRPEVSAAHRRHDANCSSPRATTRNRRSRAPSGALGGIVAPTGDGDDVREDVPHGRHRVPVRDAAALLPQGASRHRRAAKPEVHVEM